MTGGARGRCSPATVGTVPNYAGSYGYGRAMGMRRGDGGGYGWYPPVASPVYPADAADEMDTLKAEADYLKKSLDAINTRIDAMERKPAKES